jgi:hypothetical protein
VNATLEILKMMPAGMTAMGREAVSAEVMLGEHEE